MIPKYLLAFALMTGLTPAGAGADKQRDWQRGTLLDQSGYFIEASSGSHVAPTSRYRNFLIEGPAYAYLVKEYFKTARSKPTNVTVNAPVKFAIDNSRLFLIDKGGKEHEMEIVLTMSPGNYRRTGIVP